jgi:hypothetical protein
MLFDANISDIRVFADTSIPLTYIELILVLLIEPFVFHEYSLAAPDPLTIELTSRPLFKEYGV